MKKYRHFSNTSRLNLADNVGSVRSGKHHLIELALLFQQFLRVPILDHSPLGHNYDPIILGHSHQSVCDSDHCLVAKVGLEHCLQLLVSTAVDIGSGFVHDHDAGVPEQRPPQAE